MTPELQSIFFPALGGLFLILLSIIAWFLGAMYSRWEESHKHHYANNNDLRNHVTSHHGRIKNIEVKVKEHDDLFDELDDKITELQ